MMRNKQVWNMIGRIAASDAEVRGDWLLATVVRVEGSAYRKAGAMMLVREDGARVGMISGGCLEQDLVLRARELLKQGISRTVVYDMRNSDEDVWGVGAGCNGCIHVLLEPLRPALRAQLKQAKQLLDRGVAVTAIHQWNERRGTVRCLYVPVPHEEPPIAGASNVIDDDDESQWFIRTLYPQPRLVLFGAGEDARPLAAMASHAGFDVHAADWRPELCHAAHYPDARIWLARFPVEITRQLVMREVDFAVLMTHRFDYDQTLLAWLLRKPLAYLGILGPRHRTSRLLGGEFALPSWAHSPAGLAIGAEGPEQIAVSIVSQMIQTLNDSQPQRTDHAYETNDRNLSGSGEQHPHGAK